MNYDVREIALKYCVSEETVKRWVRQGKLNAHKRIGCGLKLFVTEEELERFEQSVEGAPRKEG